MTNWTCHDCGSYEVFKSKLVRINRLACIIDDVDDVRAMTCPTSWCEDCEAFVILVEAREPKYRDL